MRAGWVVVVLALAACTQPRVPDSAAGVGFGSYSEYLRARDAQLAGTAAPAPVAPGPAAPPPAVVAGPIGAPLPLPPAATAQAAPPAATAQAVPPVAAAPGSPTISDEQDFGAVSSRETIQSDAERRRAQQAQLVVVQPTAVPVRTGPSGPNVVEYALATRHDPGTKLYSRFPIRFTGADAACARYPSDDLAQEAFLAAGGPERDGRNLDPDGDGFACGWDPRPFRAAVQ